VASLIPTPTTILARDAWCPHPWVASRCTNNNRSNWIVMLLLLPLLLA